jgi:hypothetical protein
MRLDFFTGYHGSGKTYTANKLLSEIDAELADTGPIMRASFSTSGSSDYDEWDRQCEIELGPDYSNIIVANGLRQVILGRRPQHLFVVGNRDINGINYIREQFEDNDESKILLFKKPFAIMKSGYETRTGKALSNDEFAIILKDDEARGLLGIKEYCENHKDFCDIIESDKYDHDSIVLAKRAILRIRRK